MDRYFTRVFYKFLFGFALIVMVAFGVLVVLGTQSVPDVDNTAAGQ